MNFSYLNFSGNNFSLPMSGQGSCEIFEKDVIANVCQVLDTRIVFGLVILAFYFLFQYTIYPLLIRLIDNLDKKQKVHPLIRPLVNGIDSTVDIMAMFLLWVMVYMYWLQNSIPLIYKIILIIIIGSMILHILISIPIAVVRMRKKEKAELLFGKR